MTAETVRRRAPDVRPQQIVDAALAEFGEQGLAGARLDDIARRAGIAKGTIYLYFPNKEELFREVVRQTIVTRLDELRREFGAPGDGTATDQLRAYMRSWWATVTRPAFRTVYRLVVGELHRFPELLAFYLDEVALRAKALHADVIARGVANGEFRAVDPGPVSRIIAAGFITHALWVGMPVPSIPAMGTLDHDVIFAQLEAFALAALRPDPGSAAGGEAAPDARPDGAPSGAPGGGPTLDAHGVPTA
jgi:AcrR family transcriptional regulator